MREIKFRAWDKLKKSMHEVGGINFIEGIAILWKQTGSVHSTYYAEIDTIELLEYTGLKDKNGVEVNEGDIVYAGAWGSAGYYDTDNYVVEFDEGAFRGFRREYYKRKNRFSMSLPLYKLEDIEILGNIYQNKRIKKA